MTKEYDDIIHLPHHVSTTRAQMAVIDRAAQFAPFAALSGHDAAIKDTARQTEKRIELDEYMKEAFNDKLQIIADWINEHPEIEITYFQPDEKKDGGTYITTSCTVKKIDEYEKVAVMEEGTEIPIEDIINIEGQIFQTLGEV